MADLEFTFSFVPASYADVIQRAAVLYPLTDMPRKDKRSKAEFKMRQQTARLLAIWRARVSRLTSEGWEPRTNNTNFARNCCPAFAYATPRTRPCNNRMVCPWCYSRWVRSVWQRIDKAFPNPRPRQPTVADDEPYLEVPSPAYGGVPVETEMHGRQLRSVMLDPDGGPVNGVTFPFHLVEQHHTFYRSYLPKKAKEQGFNVDTYIEFLLQDIAANRANLISGIDHYGAFVFTTVEPRKDGNKAGWKIRHRRLFKVKPDYEFPDTFVAATRGRFMRHERPSRSCVFRAVARACRFPIQLIKGDAERTAQLLAARQRSRVRMSSTFKSFRMSTLYDE